MNPAVEAPLAAGTLVLAVALLWLVDWMAAAWRRVRASPACKAAPPDVPAVSLVTVQPVAAPVPYDAGPLTIAPREEL